SVGEHLRRIRGERHLSLASIAEQAEISVATLSRIETNKQNIDVSLLMTLSRILGVQASEVLGDVDAPDDSDALVRALARRRMAERARIFIDSSRQRNAAIADTVDDLLVTI